jgi:hypothetical protein
MDTKGSFLVRFLLVLITLGVLAAGAYLVFQTGQAQGYALGQAAAGQSLEAPPLPYPGYYPYLAPYRGFFFPPFFGLLCIGGFLFLFLLAGGRWFRPHHWHTHPHGPYEHWHGWEEGKRPGSQAQPDEGISARPGEQPESS